VLVDLNSFGPTDFEKAATAFDFKADTTVLLKSDVTAMEHWLPFSDALLTAAFYTARRISFLLATGSQTTEIHPLFVFDGQGAFRGDVRALRIMERQNEIFETIAKTLT